MPESFVLPRVPWGGLGLWVCPGPLGFVLGLWGVSWALNMELSAPWRGENACGWLVKSLGTLDLGAGREKNG